MLVELHEAADADRSKQERNGHPGGVERKQNNAFNYSLSHSGHGEDTSKDRSDTRSPTERKCYSQQKGTD